MTTITLKNDVKLNKTNFVNIDELLIYLLSFSSSEIEYEDFNQDEIKQINILSWVKNFENAIKSLKV